MNKKKTAASLTLAANQKEKEKAYWLNQLSGHGVKDSFPFDYESDGVVPYRRETVDFPLPRGITRPLAALSKGSNQRLFIVLAAGILLLLRKYSGSTDIQLGMPVSRPAQEDAQLLNTALVLRCPVDDSASFRGLLSQMRRTIIEAEEHQNFPVHALVDLLGFTWTPPEGIPLFDVAVSLENIHLDSLHEFTPNIVVSFQRTGEADANVTGNFHYNAERYQPETIQRLARHFFRLLEQVLGDPDQPMDSIRLLSEEEKQRILVEFNDTTDDSPQPHPVHHLVDRQARLTPGEDAVIYKDQRLSYNQLNEKSDRAAAMLKQKGIKPNQIVAVLVDHTPEMVITLLGILKAGAGYLPIDPSFPPKRIEYIVRDSNAQYVVTIEKYLDNTSGFPEKVLPYSQLTDHTDSLPGLPPEEAEKYYDPRHLAYIMYTSGSAGVPKGVMIEHRSFVDFTTWAVDAFGHRPGYRALLSNSYASDGSIQQIYPPLVSGGVLHLIDKELRLDVSAYLHYLKENRINNIDEVPVLMNEMLKPVRPEDTEELLPDLTCLTLGSEYVPIDLVRKCRQHLNHNGHIINAYGPAEASVETTTYHFDGRSQREMSLIGKPRRNIKVYILDKEGNCSPIGVRGEICISGVGIARGYLNRPLLTAEKFDTDLKKEKNDTSASSEVIYKTGDQGCWMADGNIRFLGRIDDQIKVRGFRVELSEIQQVLINMPQVRDAVAVTRENPSGDNEICAYYVLNGETRPGSDEIREYLEDRLPHYMIPSHFVELEKIPLTPNGKVDKDALPQPHDLAVDQYAAPRDDLEKKLVAVWSEVLDRVPDTIGIHNDFFKIGGHSLKATVLASRLQKQLDLDIPFIQVFKTSTIAGLADYLKGAGKSRYNPIQPAELKEYYVLSPVQKRLFIIQQIDPESTAYNVPQVKAIDKSIGKDQLEDIFKQLIARHQLLRTSFATIREEAVQRIHDHVRFQVEPFDLTGTRTGQNESENESIDRELTQINARFIRPFDMEKAPLMRVAHVTMETGNLLIVDMHHTVCDIVS
ncbi:MAG: amino acid adenylation domain-containing protein, partial [bacterium]|nr:amino acid adenylation domain-containing protein [bacterium]